MVIYFKQIKKSRKKKKFHGALETYLDAARFSDHTIKHDGVGIHCQFFFLSGGTCPCNVSTRIKTHQINATCLPPPYSFSVYSVTAMKATGQPMEQTASKCISVSPGNDLQPVIT